MTLIVSGVTAQKLKDHKYSLVYVYADELTPETINMLLENEIRFNVISRSEDDENIS